MDTVIRFRVATSDKVLFEQAAKRAGQSLSEWARSKLLAVSAVVGPAPETFKPSDPLPVIREDAAKVKPVSRPLTRKEREAKIDAFQRKMVKGKK